jgi:hypothetical protein
MSVHEQVFIFYTAELCELYKHLFSLKNRHTHTHTHTNTYYISLILNLLHLLVQWLQILLKNCWFSCDAVFITDSMAFRGVSRQVLQKNIKMVLALGSHFVLEELIAIQTAQVYFIVI